MSNIFYNSCKTPLIRDQVNPTACCREGDKNEAASIDLHFAVRADLSSAVARPILESPELSGTFAPSQAHSIGGSVIPAFVAGLENGPLLFSPSSLQNAYPTELAAYCPESRIS